MKKILKQSPPKADQPLAGIILKGVVFVVVAILAFSFISPVLAQTPTGITVTPSQVPKIIYKMATWLYRVVFVVSIIFFLMSAFLYMTANPNNIKKANNHLLYGTVGVAIAIISFSLTKIITWFLGP